MDSDDNAPPTPPTQPGLAEVMTHAVRAGIAAERKSARMRARLRHTKAKRETGGSETERNHTANIAEVKELLDTKTPLQMASLMGNIDPSSSIAAVAGVMTDDRIAKEREQQEWVAVHNTIAKITPKAASDPDNLAGFLDVCKTIEHRALMVRELVSKVEAFIATFTTNATEATTSSALNVVFVNMIRSLQQFPDLAHDGSFLTAMNCIHAEHTIAIRYNKKTDACKEAAAQMRLFAQGLGASEKELRLMKEANEVAKFQRGDKN